MILQGGQWLAVFFGTAFAGWSIYAFIALYRFVVKGWSTRRLAFMRYAIIVLAPVALFGVGLYALDGMVPNLLAAQWRQALFLALKLGAASWAAFTLVFGIAIAYARSPWPKSVRPTRRWHNAGKRLFG